MEKINVDTASDPCMLITMEFSEEHISRVCESLVNDGREKTLDKMFGEWIQTVHVNREQEAKFAHAFVAVTEPCDAAELIKQLIERCGVMCGKVRVRVNEAGMAYSLTGGGDNSVGAVTVSLSAVPRIVADLICLGPNASARDVMGALLNVPGGYPPSEDDPAAKA